MPSRHATGDCLHDILDNIARIENYADGQARDAVERNGQLRDAIERCLERICEAAARLGDRATELLPD